MSRYRSWNTVLHGKGPFLLIKKHWKNPGRGFNNKVATLLEVTTLLEPTYVPKCFFTIPNGWETVYVFFYSPDFPRLKKNRFKNCGEFIFS
jgi:hypothetical protein